MKEDVKNEKRNVGLDFLRIISMIMVLTLHYLGKGGLLNSDNVDETSYIFFNFLKALSVAAVNCYILISGYFLVKSQFKMKKLLKLWGEVVFYSIIIYIVIVLLKLEGFSIKKLISVCFPVITKKYWFITVYLVMYALFPFINKLIYALNKEEHKKLIIIMFAIFSLPSIILPSTMLLDDTGGYGIIWFVCLYLIAAYIRLYVTKDELMKQKKVYRPLYLGIAFIITVGVVGAQYVCKKLNIADMSYVLFRYSNPLVLIEAIALFLLFNTIEIKSEIIQKGILFVAPLTFAVYIIHEQANLKSILYTKILHTDICYHNQYAIFIIIGSIFAVFAICICIEFLRSRVEKYISKKIMELR